MPHERFGRETFGREKDANRALRKQRAQHEASPMRKLAAGDVVVLKKTNEKAVVEEYVPGRGYVLKGHEGVYFPRNMLRRVRRR